MTRRDLTELTLLGALWGASFLFMRVAGPEFGPAPLACLRAVAAAAVLVPLALWMGHGQDLRRHWRPIALVGAMNSAAPFTLFALAMLAISGGLAAILNATVPLWTAVVAWLWLRERPTRRQALGLAVGFAGVVSLSAGKASLAPGSSGVSPAMAIAACLLATVLYGLAANFTRRHLAKPAPIALAAGSQVSASLLLAPLALWTLPTQWPGPAAWAAALALALASTGFAYLLFFRLISRIGPTRTVTVTFLIPMFAMLWGAIFLAEWPTPVMLAGCGLIFAGVALASGAFRVRSTAPRP